MTPYTQAFVHDPAAGVRGDCYRTAIACLLDVPRDDVPHVNDCAVLPSTVRDATNAYLASRGLAICEIPLSLDGDAFDVAAWMTSLNPGVPFLLSGMSPRDVDHSVVISDGVMHDPHPSRGGLVGPCEGGHWWIGILARAR
jgi:hypothetical protein